MIVVFEYNGVLHEMPEEQMEAAYRYLERQNRLLDAKC